MRNLKVWGHIMCGHRVIVAARTKREALKRLQEKYRGISGYYFRGWWGETRNDAELAAATEPGIWRQVGQAFSNTPYERVG